MKIKTFLEKDFFFKGSLEKIENPHCYCPSDGHKVDCSVVCVKCKHFRWFNEKSISCTYGQLDNLTFTKKKKRYTLMNIILIRQEPK